MKAARIHRFGGPEVFRIEEIDPLQPGEGELLIKVHAAGINPVDAKIRSGQFPRFHPHLPAVLGRDVSGVIVRVTGFAEGWNVGDAVFGMLDYARGAYAEYALASPREIASRPVAVGDLRAAAIPVAGLTAWQALFVRGELRSGQRVLIHGGAGGVGHFAVQFASARGAEVVVSASARNLDFVRELGAYQIIDLDARRFEDEIDPVDLVLDLLAGETRERSWQVLKPGGILVATLGEPRPPDPAPSGVEGREVVVEASSEQLNEIAALVDSGRIKVSVNRAFPLSAVGEAHEHLEYAHARGMVVLAVAESMDAGIL